VSSLGGLIVFAVLTAVSLAVMGYMVIFMVTHNQLFMERVKYVEKIGERCKGYLEIESMEKLQDNRTVEAVIKNVGAGSIPVEDFDEIDLIMIYRNSNGSVRAEWLPYDPSGDLEKGWRVLNITYHGVDELKNPVAAIARVNSVIKDPIGILIHPSFLILSSGWINPSNRAVKNLSSFIDPSMLMTYAAARSDSWLSCLTCGRYIP